MCEEVEYEDNLLIKPMDQDKQKNDDIHNEEDDEESQESEDEGEGEDAESGEKVLKVRERPESGESDVEREE